MRERDELLKKLRSEIIEKGLLTANEFRALENRCERSDAGVIEELFSCGKCQEKDILVAISHTFGYPPINIQTFQIEDGVLRLIPKEIARKYKVIPVSQHEKTLTVAVCDPTNLGVLDDLRALVGQRIKVALAVPSQLKAAVEKYYGRKSARSAFSTGDSFEKIMEDMRNQLSAQHRSKLSDDFSDLLEAANATPVVRFVNHTLIEAVRRKASDVFIEPLDKTMRVRYRIDGVLEEIVKSPKSFVEPVISRVKVMSRLNIAERRVPQDGRFKARVMGPEVDFRVSVLPTCFGEKACLRILDPSTEAHKLEQLGFDVGEQEIIRKASLRPHGMILITGPTGSGKTTTLYAILQQLSSLEKNIMTVEDPVEYQTAGINQVNVRETVGLTFPVALRSILRQDPDIILIGEIRDLVTMDIAIKAALTGHLVLSTLHTNDATSAIVRMINMGIEPFLITSSIIAISAQRLVRKLCTQCRTPYSADEPLLKPLGLNGREKADFFKPKGCERCRGSGYRGRTVISELFEMKPPIPDLIVTGASHDELRRAVIKNGMRTLRESGIQKAKEGVTSIEEILRVTSTQSGQGAET